MTWQFQSLHMVRSPYSVIRLAVVLLILLIVFMVCLAFVPWRQTIMASGEVTVFSPMHRPQTINALIEGRLIRWFVKEGDMVRKGQLLGLLQDIRPEFMDPKQLKRYESQRKAYLTKRQALISMIEALEGQQKSLQATRASAVSGAEKQVGQASNRVAAARQNVISAERNVKTAEWNLARRERLYRQGLRSKRDLELAELDMVRASAELQAAQAQLALEERGVSVSRFNRTQLGAEIQARIQDVQARRADAQDKLATVESELARLDVEIANLKQRIAQRRIVSPITGQVVRVYVLGAGQSVTVGMPIALVAPLIQDQAVALYMTDNDAPLLALGRPVRLQFSGWPAIQFMGWPSVAYGTFAGKIAAIDSADGKTRGFRILVKPDVDAIRSGKEEP
ncbi:MAG TPA: biotin/lipoyl-binding protein, partial [Oculatellaceae cyanobacterium]